MRSQEPTLYYQEYLHALMPEIEKVKKKVARFLDLDIVHIPVEIACHPRRINFAKYECKVQKKTILCNLIKIHLDVYDIEQTLSYLTPSVRTLKDLMLYLFAHEYAHHLLFIKEPSLFRFRPNLLTMKKKKLPLLYREGYSLYELFADTVAYNVCPRIHKQVLKRTDIDYLGSPYRELHRRFMLYSRKQFLHSIEQWDKLIGGNIYQRVEPYKVKIRWPSKK